MATTTITLKVEALINASLEKTWKSWNEPENITKWYFASNDWHSPKAENNLKIGGAFKTRMEAKDGSFGFDFSGVYTNIIEYKLIESLLDDGRKLKVEFALEGESTKVTETFEPENENSHELQQTGWQSILNNFKKYTESI